MELFRDAAFVRLRSHGGKYLAAGVDGRCVTLQNIDSRGASLHAVWAIERVTAGADRREYVRLQGPYGGYLTAYYHHSLHILSADPPEPNASSVHVEAIQRGLNGCPCDTSGMWSPERAGQRVMLRSRFGRVLHASDSTTQHDIVTVDVPAQESVIEEGMYWEVEVVPTAEAAPVPSDNSSCTDQSTDAVCVLHSEREQQRRKIVYAQIGASGTVKGKWRSLEFCGRSLAALRRRLAKELGLSNFIVCCQGGVFGRLAPLLVDLPCDDLPMEVYLALESSKVAQTFQYPDVNA